MVDCVDCEGAGERGFCGVCGGLYPLVKGHYLIKHWRDVGEYGEFVAAHFNFGPVCEGSGVEADTIFEV